MPAGLVLGGIGLSITIVDKTIKAIEFIVTTVDDVEHLGEHVPKLKTRLSCECARLQGFRSFLLQENEEGTKRLDELPLVSQDAILGMIQELELLFGSYSMYLEKHNIEELQRGYETNVRLEKDLKKLADKRKEERKEIQERVTQLEATKWALFRKKKITRLIEEIEEWNGRLMGLLLCGFCFGSKPVHFRPQDRPSLDELRLSTGLTLRALIEEQNQACDSATSSFQVGAILETEDSESQIQTLVQTLEDGQKTRTRVFVEFKPYELRRRATQPAGIVIQRVKNLAKLLAHAKAPDAGFRTLLCVALVQQIDPTRFAFAFELPEESFPTGLMPLTLQQAIESKSEVRPTLGERFTMATAIAQTVFELHSVHWLHKSIRSENILFGREIAGPDAYIPTYSRPFIVGFEFSREENDRSTTEQDGRLERNIYRHPDRQGAPDDSARFTALHDIYALGVVMLEIGLWRPAYGFEDYSDADPDSIMRSLQDHARDRLPHYMGEAYTNAVLKCLEQTLVEPEVAKKLILPVHRDQSLEVNMALSREVVDEIKNGVKAT